MQVSRRHLAPPSLPHPKCLSAPLASELCVALRSAPLPGLNTPGPRGWLRLISPPSRNSAIHAQVPRGKDYRCLSPLFSIPVVLPSGQHRQKRKKRGGGLTSMTVKVPTQEERADSYWRGSDFGSRKGLGESQTPQWGCCQAKDIREKSTKQVFVCFWMLFFYLEAEQEDAAFWGFWQSGK